MILSLLRKSSAVMDQGRVYERPTDVERANRVRGSVQMKGLKETHPHKKTNSAKIKKTETSAGSQKKAQSMVYIPKNSQI